MRISTRARYALRLMVELARQSDGVRPVQLRQIAEDNDLSHGYLEQLMIALRNAALVRGLSGRKGGYFLTRGADEISLRQIIEAAIGPISLAECVLCPENCGRSMTCESRPVWLMLNAVIRDALDRYTLADMASDEWLTRISGALKPLAGELTYPGDVISRKQRDALRRRSRRSRPVPSISGSRPAKSQP